MKLFELLASFSSEELRRAKKAVQSPLFSSSARVEMLFDLLRKQHPDFPETEAFKRKLFKKIFAKEKYNDYKLRRIFTELREILEDYLLYAKMKSDNHRRDLALTKIYAERNLYDFFKKKTEQLLQKIEEYPYPDSELLLDKAMLMRAFYGHNGTPKLQEYEYLVKSMETLHLYYMGERITTKLTYQTLNKTWAKPLELSFETTLQPLESIFTEEHSLNYLLYAKIWELIATDDEVMYQKISELFDKNMDSFTELDRNAIFRSLTNYCLTKINSGNKVFNNHLFNLFKKGIETEVLMNNKGFIKHITFKNIAINAVQVNEFEWCENFILSYKDKLETEHRDEITTICLGYLFFFKNDFSKTIDVLLAIDFKNINNVISSKGLLMRSYFELFLQNDSYFSMLESFMNAYYKFLSRSKLSKVKKERHLNLISQLRQISKQINTTDNANEFIKEWESKVESNKSIAFRVWFENMINKIRKRKCLQ